MLILSDFHPFSTITEFRNGKTTIEKSYFNQNPRLFKEGPDMHPTIQFLWKLSDVSTRRFKPDSASAAWKNSTSTNPKQLRSSRTTIS